MLQNNTIESIPSYRFFFPLFPLIIFLIIGVIYLPFSTFNDYYKHINLICIFLIELVFLVFSFIYLWKRLKITVNAEGIKCKNKKLIPWEEIKSAELNKKQFYKLSNKATDGLKLTLKNGKDLVFYDNLNTDLFKIKNFIKEEIIIKRKLFQDLSEQVHLANKTINIHQHLKQTNADFNEIKYFYDNTDKKELKYLPFLPVITYIIIIIYVNVTWPVNSWYFPAFFGFLLIVLFGKFIYIPNCYSIQGDNLVVKNYFAVQSIKLFQQYENFDIVDIKQIIFTYRKTKGHGNMITNIIFIIKNNKEFTFGMPFQNKYWRPLLNEFIERGIDVINENPNL